MARIWPVLLLSAMVCGLVKGEAGATSSALMESGNAAVKLLLTLLGTMTLWSGLMELLSASGDVQRLGRLFRRLGRPLFPGLTDEASWAAMGMNLAANLLGLGNAATPAGIEAARQLSGQGAAGLMALAMMLVIDNSSMQIIPTTVIALRQAAGSAAPADIWGATLLSSGAATVMGVVLMVLLQKGGARDARSCRGGHCDHGRADSAAGRDSRS